MNNTKTVKLELDDGSILKCRILHQLKVNGLDYIILLPLDIIEPGNSSSRRYTEGDILIYRYIVHEAEDPTLENITDDAEYLSVTAACETWFKQEEAAAPSSEYDLEFEEDEEAKED